MQTFTLLGASQEAYIKSRNWNTTQQYLLPCWSEKDLFSFGKAIYGFATGDMEKRYAISGSSVRVFTWETLEKISEEKKIALQAVPNALSDYGNEQPAFISVDQIDRVIRTNVRNAEDPSHYTNPRFWIDVIDSEYILEGLSTRIRPG